MIVLPPAYCVAGVLLILIALVAVGLFLLKLREVASLKKEVMELRDTMRMMRYEEANLSRMLHTVDKISTISSAPELSELIPEESVTDEIEIKEMEIYPDTTKESIVNESVAEEVMLENVGVSTEKQSELTLEDDTVTEEEIVCEEFVQEMYEEAKDELTEELV